MLNKLFKLLSDFLGRLPGLPILLAVVLVALNFVLRLLPDWPVVGWLASTDLLLHLGVILGLVGLLLGEAL
jgi:TRAP-type mannitol/chloroaromatic compound transport system permease small subunit